MKGLSSAEVKQALVRYGPNELRVKHTGWIGMFVKLCSAPASLMLIVASVLSFSITRVFDGFFILALLVLNVGVSFWHARKTDTALAALQKQLSVSVKVLRDGLWKEVPSSQIVPGDVVTGTVGSLIAADMHIDAATHLEINEAVLTGESMAKEKKEGDTAYSGSVVTTGTFTGTITATGNNAFFGKIVTSKKTKKRKSKMEQEVLSISRFLIIASILATTILTIVFLFEGIPFADIAILDLSILIAGLPVSLPTVMTLIVSIGAFALAQKKVLVRRLASLEDLANVTLLLTDKTGTLTENKISVEQIHAYAPFSKEEVALYASSGARATAESTIDKAIIGCADAFPQPKLSILGSIPADSTRKHSTALVEYEGERYLISLGTPPVVSTFCILQNGLGETIHADTLQAAADGSRAIAVAIKKNPVSIEDEKKMICIGVLVLTDPLRTESKKTITFLKEQGIQTIMVTGDTKETATHVAQMLDLSGSIVSPEDGKIEDLPVAAYAATAAFAQVLPEDKLALVTHAQQGYVVAVTGDGVNDLPAVRKADVGIAVANAVDALKGTADIVLLDSSISVVGTALIEARKIFFRLYNYSIYRISESFRLIVTALVLGLIIKGFPLTPVQLILLAFLNDVPIITLAFDRVKRLDRPADLRPEERFKLGTLFGLVGVANSLCFYFFLAEVIHLPLALVQTAFFLKLTVSGHMLIYVAHTKERWWKFLPEKRIIVATSLTQAVATLLALGGLFVAALPAGLVVLVWVWSFFWMQIGELMKWAQSRMLRFSFT